MQQIPLVPPPFSWSSSYDPSPEATSLGYKLSPTTSLDQLKPGGGWELATHRATSPSCGNWLKNKSWLCHLKATLCNTIHAPGGQREVRFLLKPHSWEAPHHVPHSFLRFFLPQETKCSPISMLDSAYRLCLYELRWHPIFPTNLGKSSCVSIPLLSLKAQCIRGSLKNKQERVV